jgi:hypothetical protein
VRHYEIASAADSQKTRDLQVETACHLTAVSAASLKALASCWFGVAREVMMNLVRNEGTNLQL